jgi:hypothetical protein
MDVVSWIAEHRVATLTPGPHLSSLVEHLTGRPVRGPWWEHPQQHRIFAAYQVLHHHPDVLSTRLVGRVTFLHRPLWPALFRVVAEPSYRSRAERHLPPPAPALLGEVRESGRVNLQGFQGTERRVLQRARRELEERLLLHADHLQGRPTDSVAHLQSWEHGFRAQLLESTALSYQHSLNELMEACNGQAEALERYG